jgi:DNA-binding CsgD family transcriptional regulator
VLRYQYLVARNRSVPIALSNSCVSFGTPQGTTVADTTGTQRNDSILEVASALQSGLVLVDTSGAIVWVDEQTRRRVDGELGKLNLPLSKQDARASLDCMLAAVDIEVAGEPRTITVIQALDSQAAALDLHRILTAVEEVMADSSWFTRPLLEKLKASLQAEPPGARAADIDMLSAREREVLLLVCEGRSDVEMGRILNLSQNTVRNHLASLFKKIGVNRRSAAIIWARERAITRHDLAKNATTRRSGRAI